MKLSVVVPVYNERGTVLEVIRRLQALELPCELEIVVVDDGSRDGTAEILRELPAARGLVVHLCPSNAGKGAALRKGFELVTGDWVVIQDADLELDPGEHPRLLAEVLSGRAQVVFGSRYLGKRPAWRSLNWWANQVLTAVTNLLFGAGITDMETCYKLFPAAFVKDIELEARRFEIEPELTAKASRLGYRIHELPIAYAPRTVDQGKKMRWRDGFAAIAMLLRVRCARRESLLRERSR